MLPPRVRAHIVTAGGVALIIAVAYGTVKTGQGIKRWINSSPLEQHAEMELYLYKKEQQALRQLQQQQQQKA